MHHHVIALLLLLLLTPGLCSCYRPFSKCHLLYTYGHRPLTLSRELLNPAWRCSLCFHLFVCLESIIYLVVSISCSIFDVALVLSTGCRVAFYTIPVTTLGIPSLFQKTPPRLTGCPICSPFLVVQRSQDAVESPGMVRNVHFRVRHTIRLPHKHHGVS